MSDYLEIELTAGAVRNGYIRVPMHHQIFPPECWAKDERDESAQRFELKDDQGQTFTTYLLENRSRLRHRFGAYFKERNITPGTRIRINRIDNGHYILEFHMGQKTLRDYFEEYKNDPRSDWINSYRSRCAQVDQIRNSGLSAFDDETLRVLWLEKANGIASVGQGFMYQREFQALKEQLPERTMRIISVPTPAVLDETVQWALQEKTKGNLERVIWAVICRVFAAAAPQLYSSIVDEHALDRLIGELNTRFKLAISLKGNWCTKNTAMLEAVKAQGLGDEDTFVLNTFLWRMTELFGGSVADEEEIEEPMRVEDTEKPKFPSNTIYYGPPGTGKTFNLQEILKKEYKLAAKTQSEQAFLIEKLQSLNWFEVIALVLLDINSAASVSEIIEHRFYQAKAMANGRTGNLRATAWSYLQTYTVQESTTVNHARRAEPAVFDKQQNSKWYIVEAQRDQLYEMEQMLKTIQAGPKNGPDVPLYEFVTFHQSYGYEEFVEGLRPILGEDSNEQVRYEIKQGAFRKLCERARKDPENVYAIVIDEINRGNISKIFGELITLIETDKREGMDNEARVTLAYSQHSFTVPKNVNVIGTMNTADRSLALVDTALRRRFEFIEQAPDLDLLGGVVVGVGGETIDIRRLLETMNRRIEALYDRDHAIGHGYFISLRKIASFDALGEIFENKIIPLLEEYFFEDWEKIRLVLGDNQKPEAQQFILATKLDLQGLFGFNHELEADNMMRRFARNKQALSEPRAYIGIYQDID